MKKLDINYKEFLLEKGERVGLCVAGGLALLLLILTLFMPGKGLFSGTAGGHAEELNKLSGGLAQKQANAQPGPQHLPGEVKEVIDAYRVKPVDATKYPSLVAFFSAVPKDSKRQVPEILKPVEFATAVVRAQLPALEFITDPDTGKIIKVWVVKADVAGGGAGGGPGGMMASPANIGKGLGGLVGGGGGSRPPMGQGIGGQFKPEAGKSGELPIMEIPIGEAEGRTPATRVLPLRMAIVEASFPYKQQVEEFRQKLRLETHGAVLTEMVKGDKGRTVNSFKFLGLVIERMTLNPDGSAGKWEPQDIRASYNPLVVQTYKQFEKEDPRLEPILKVSRPGLVLKIPRQYKLGKYPKLETQLKTIQSTMEKLQKLDQKAVTVASNLTRTDFNPFEDDTPPQATDPTTPMSPPTGTDPANLYGSIAGESTLKETPIDYCLIRFLDVKVEAGKSYKYRFKVKMMNPNYAPKPAERKDTYPQFARDKELLSDWAYVPQTVTVPRDQFLYAVDQKNVAPKIRSQYTPNSNQAVFQIHRWVDYYRPSKDAKRNRAVGDWLIAPRIFVERGEFVRPTDAFRTLVPIKDLEHLKPELDSMPSVRDERMRHWMKVPFGDESILIDFEGGQTIYTRTEAMGDAPPKVTRIEATNTAKEVLVMRPDGKLIAHNTITDANDPVRKTRYDAVKKRVEEVLKGDKGDEDSPFGGGGSGGTGTP